MRPQVIAVAVAATIVATTLVASQGAATVTARTSSVLRVGETPGRPVSWILPFNTCTTSGPPNTTEFQPLLFRPLYWFGKGTSLGLQQPLSIGRVPVYALPAASGGYRRVTIFVKPWSVAGGGHVTAQSVRFFLNLWDAEQTVPCGFFAGDGMPSDVASVVTPLGAVGDEVVINFSTPVNATWMTDDFLSTIVPLPTAWDRTSLGAPAGSGGCGGGTFGAAATIAHCHAVYTFLQTASSNLATYATSPLWKAVDGPYRLKAFAPSGHALLVPNASYSGTPRSHLTAIELVPEATGATEQADLAAHHLQMGEVPTSALGPAPSAGVPGPNLVPGIAGSYTARWDPGWQFDYAAYNFSAADPKVAAIASLDVRRALEGSIDQSSIISTDYRGYATRGCSPIPFAGGPPNPCPSVYNPSSVIALLSSIGFTYDAALGVQVCQSASGCGPNLPQGYQLRFNLIYVSGDPQLAADVTKEVAYWAAVGIVVHAVAGSYVNTILGCTGSTYSICDYIGWEYPPAWYPTGEHLFKTGGEENWGAYTNATMDLRIAQTTSGGATNLTLYWQYAEYAGPVLWQPTPVTTSELSRACVGALPQNAFGAFLPEFIAHC